jgi:addiction module HigA family antidote
MKTTKKLAPIHPGEHLADILKEAGITANALALCLRVPANRLTLIIQGKRAITAETALRLARYFGTSAQLWMNLQTKYDLDVAEDSAAGRIEREVLPRSAA